MKPFHLISVAVLLLSCSAKENGTPVMPQPVTPEPLTPKEGYPFMGLVTSDGNPVEGAAVTDGVNIAVTDKSGRYYLQGAQSATGRPTDFIILSVPGGYRLSNTNNSIPPPTAWIRTGQNSSQNQRFDFSLTPEDQSTYSLLVLADMHLSGRTTPAGKDFDQFKEYKSYIDSYSASLAEPVYGVNLGDMTQQQYWATGSFQDYKDAFNTSFPVYNVIGNHDHNHKEKTDYAATQNYRDNLGPTYYSFNLGTQHFVVLDNMVFENAANTDDYKVTLDDIQLTWLKKDIAAAPKGTTDYVILCHVPFATLQDNGQAKKWLSNMNTVLSVFGDKKVTILSGHQHWKLSYPISENVMQNCHNSVCGSWWYTPLCHDGSPAAMEVYKFQGAEHKRSFLPLAQEHRSLRYRVYASGITTQSGYLRPKDDGYKDRAAEDDRSKYPVAVNLNLFEWEPGWTVKVLEDSKEGSCSFVPRTDFEHRNLCDNGTVPYTKYNWLSSSRTLHTLQYLPSKTGAKVTFQVSDSDGQPKYMISNIVVK